MLTPITTSIVLNPELSNTLSPAIRRPVAPVTESHESDETVDRKNPPRAHLPLTDPKMGKSRNEQRLWIREQLAAIEKDRGKRLESTMNDYRRKVARLELRRDENGAIPMSAFGNNLNTFAAMRAALVAVSVERARVALAEMSRADKAHRAAKAAGDMVQISLYKGALKKAWRDLLFAGNDIAQHPPGQARQYIASRSHFLALEKKYLDAAPSIRDLLLEKPVAPPAGAWKTAVKNNEIIPSNRRRNGKRATTSRIQKMHPDWRD